MTHQCVQVILPGILMISSLKGVVIVRPIRDRFLNIDNHSLCSTITMTTFLATSKIHQKTPNVHAPKKKNSRNKMVKEKPTNCLSVFDYFAGLALKVLTHFTLIFSFHTP